MELFAPSLSIHMDLQILFGSDQLLRSSLAGLKLDLSAPLHSEIQFWDWGLHDPQVSLINMHSQTRHI